MLAGPDSLESGLFLRKFYEKMNRVEGAVFGEKTGQAGSGLILTNF